MSQFMSLGWVFLNLLLAVRTTFLLAECWFVERFLAATPDWAGLLHQAACGSSGLAETAPAELCSDRLSLHSSVLRQISLAIRELGATFGRPSSTLSKSGLSARRTVISAAYLESLQM